MRNAKQKKSDDVAQRAQRMATERFNRSANAYNNITGNSTIESIEANRRQLKNAAVANSVLGRQGTSILNVEEPMAIEPVKAVRKQQVFLPQNLDADKHMVAKRRTQKPADQAGDSIPPAQRRAMQQEQSMQKNDVQPRFHPQQAQIQPRFVSNQQQYAPKRTDERPSFNRNEVQQAQAPRYVSAHGITHNPVEESRRRKKLEARIRELAQQGTK